MEECSVLIESTLPAEDKTSRWFNLPIDYELFRDLLGVEADSGDYQIIDMKLPFAGNIVRTTSVRRLNKLYFAYTELPPEVQQAYNDLIPYCGGVRIYCRNQKNFGFIQSVTVSWTLPVTDWNITLNFLPSPKKERNTLIWKPIHRSWKKQDVMLSVKMVCSNSDRHRKEVNHL